MPLESLEITLPSGGVISVVCTGRADGDLQVDLAEAELERRRRAIVDRPWVWMRQVHGARVVDGDTADATGAEADGVVSTASDRALAVHTADCVPIALMADGAQGPIIGAVHAGWRGLVDGVIEAAIDAMRRRGAGRIDAYVGPCICAADYAFGELDLDRVVARYGDAVRARTSDGRPALDLRVAVGTAIRSTGARVVAISERCTAESTELFSHRARQDTGRQALVVWIEPPTAAGAT